MLVGRRTLGSSKSRPRRVARIETLFFLPFRSESRAPKLGARLPSSTRLVTPDHGIRLGRLEIQGDRHSNRY
jgi:hypothetical protein